MNVGELFVNLGIKGAEKTLGALTGVKQGMKDLGSLSLETKAALVGAFYALERLFAASGQRGTELTNLEALTGMSGKLVQQYQYAARQVGVTNAEVAGSFVKLQQTATKTLMNGEAPAGLARVAQVTKQQAGDIMRLLNDVTKGHPEKLLDTLSKYAQAETNIGKRNEVLSSFGMSGNMIAAMARNAFRPDVLAKAPTYGENETKELDRVNALWGNLGNKIEMAFGHFNAKHGGELVGDISKVVDQVMKLANAFTTLAEKVHAFEALGKVFEGWGLIFGLMSESVDKLNGKVPSNKDAESPTIFDKHKAKPGATIGERLMDSIVLKDQGEGFFSIIMDALKEVGAEGKNKIPPSATAASAPKASQNPVSVHVKNPANKQPPEKPNLKLVVPSSPTLPKPDSVVRPTALPHVEKGGVTQHIDVKQNMTFNHPGTDHKKTGESVGKAVKDVFNQMPSRGAGN